MADFIQPFRNFAGDPIGTLRRGADNGQRVPRTRTKTSYALTIHATVGNRRGVIGGIFEVSPQQDLQVDEQYEIDANARGLPRELIPQLVTGRRLDIKRYDLFAKTIEQVFSGPREIVTLADQIGPVNIRFSWKSPESSSLGPIIGGAVMQVYEFVDCYITRIGRTISAQDDIIVRADASMVWRNLRQLQ